MGTKIRKPCEADDRLFLYKPEMLLRNYLSMCSVNCLSGCRAPLKYQLLSRKNSPMDDWLKVWR